MIKVLIIFSAIFSSVYLFIYIAKQSFRYMDIKFFRLVENITSYCSGKLSSKIKAPL